MITGCKCLGDITCEVALSGKYRLTLEDLIDLRIRVNRIIDYHKDVRDSHRGRSLEKYNEYDIKLEQLPEHDYLRQIESGIKLLRDREKRFTETNLWP
jgi:hypothetical protein